MEQCIFGGDFIFLTDGCTEEYKKLYEMYNKAESILNNIGFTDITVTRICFNNRLKTTLGR